MTFRLLGSLFLRLRLREGLEEAGGLFFESWWVWGGFLAWGFTCWFGFCFGFPEEVVCGCGLGFRLFFYGLGGVGGFGFHGDGRRDWGWWWAAGCAAFGVWVCYGAVLCGGFEGVFGGGEELDFSGYVGEDLEVLRT